MAQVQIAFPEPAGSEVTVPIVHAEQEPVNMSEHIIWNFFGKDERIKRVRITFKKGEPFFGSSSTIDKPYDGDASIWGVAPKYKNRTKCKYTIEGLDSSGERVFSLLDPEIIVDDPNKP